MAAALEPGMWVEVVKTAPGAAEFIGRIFQVSEVGDWLGEAFVNLHGWPKPKNWPGWSARSFRPIYRPKQEIIEALKAPPKVAPVRKREDA